MPAIEIFQFDLSYLALALSLLERPAELADELEQLGARHAAAGQSREHYEIVRRALLDMLAEVMGDAFTSEMRAAWSELYDFIEAAMPREVAVARESDQSF